MERDNIWKMVGIGDIVEAFFDHHVTDGPEVATRQYRVLNIDPRYGSAASPLIKAVPVDGKTDWYHTDHGYNMFAGSYITKVVSKAKGPHITQRFHPHYYPKNRIITRTDEAGRLFGPFDSIVYDIISTLPAISLTTKIDINRAWKLFCKSKPGFIGIDEPFNRYRARLSDVVTDEFTMQGWIRVNRKAFKRWLLQNINKMQATKRELDAWQDQVDKEDYEQSMEDFDDLMDRFEARLESERAHEPDPEVGNNEPGQEDWRDDEELSEVNRAEDDEPYDHHPTDDYIHDPGLQKHELDAAQTHDEHNYDAGDADPGILATFDQDQIDINEQAHVQREQELHEEAQEYFAGHAFLHEQERLRKMNEEAYPPHDPQPIQHYERMRNLGPKSIGDLITINQMNEFLEEFKDSSIPRERIDQARDILRRVKLSTLYPQDEDQLGLLGAKIDEYDRIYGEREIKDDAL